MRIISTIMATFLLVMAAAVGLAAQTPAQPPKTFLKVGDIAPDFSLPSTLGGQIKLSDYKDKKTVVLSFYPAAFTGG